jgi:hypothetical protein
VTTEKKPLQLRDLIVVVKECVEQGHYVLTEHALQRMRERGISLNDAEYVLKNGYHEKRKSSFDPTFKTWKYAIRGKTIDESDIRIIVSFDERDMVVITLMHVGEELKT